MTVVRTASGRWRVKIKSGRSDIASRTFDRKKDAQDWEAAQRRALDLGEYIDPRAGRESVAEAWARWQGTRSNSKSATTQNTDRAAFKALPVALRNRPVAAVPVSTFETLYDSLLGTLARASVLRYRVTYGSFFAWCQREKIARTNPALAVKVPAGRATNETNEIFPFTIDELRAVHLNAVERAGTPSGDLVLVLGLTGLRPGEAFALRVRDVQHLPVPALRVSRSKTDGAPVRNVTKGGRSRVVPMVGEVWSVIEPLTRDRGADDLLFPARGGGFRSLANWKRDTGWSDLGMGRRVYDLRHTAASWWLSQGMPLQTVADWLGHSSTKITADRYVHVLGPAADAAAVEKLNEILGGRAGGTSRNLRMAGGATPQ